MSKRLRLTYEQRLVLSLKRRYEKEEATALLYAEYEKMVERLNEKHVECEAFRELVSFYKGRKDETVIRLKGDLKRAKEKIDKQNSHIKSLSEALQKKVLKQKIENQKDQIKKLMAVIEKKNGQIKELESKMDPKIDLYIQNLTKEE